MYKSTDGGFSFPNDIGNTIHVDQHVLAFAPGNANTIYVGNDGGLFVSKAGAAFVFEGSPDDLRADRSVRQMWLEV